MTQTNIHSVRSTNINIQRAYCDNLVVTPLEINTIFSTMTKHWTRLAYKNQHQDSYLESTSREIDVYTNNILYHPMVDTSNLLHPLHPFQVVQMQSHRSTDAIDLYTHLHLCKTWLNNPNDYYTNYNSFYQIRQTLKQKTYYNTNHLS